MLIISSGSCDKCCESVCHITQQEASVTCKKCSEIFQVCSTCKQKGCPKCDGKLESKMDWASKNGILF